MGPEVQDERPGGQQGEQDVASGGGEQVPPPVAGRLRRLAGRRHAPLLLVLGLATALRAVTFLQIQDSPILFLHHWSETDMHFYHNWARQIVAGDWLTDASVRPYHSWHMHVARAAHAASGSAAPFDDVAGRRIWDGWLGPKTFYQDPLYPYFLALCYAAFGESVLAVYLAQSVLGLLCVALVWRLALRLFDRPVALLAGVMAALFGPLVFYESLLLRSVLQTLLGLAALEALAGAFEAGAGRARAACGGALCGLAFLAQSSALIFVLWAALLLAFRQRRALGGFVLGFLLAASPLVARNVAVGIPPFSLAASGAVTFLNHNAVDYQPEAGDFLSAHAADILQRTGGRLLPVVRETLLTHPDFWSVLRLLGRKLYVFWHWYELPNNANYDYFCLWAPALGRVALGFGWIGPLALLGLALALRRGPGCLLAAGFVASGLATSLIFYHLSRFRLPFACAMIPFAAFAAVSWLRWLGSGRFLRAGLALVALAALGAALWRPLTSERSRIWVADYGVGNEILVNVAQQRAARGDLRGAVELLERGISLEPPDLSAARWGPEATRLEVFSAQIAGGFVPLHELCARLQAALGEPARAEGHRVRAEVLRIVAGQFEQRQKAEREAGR